ncbi:STAS domain-containing protein [Lysobacter sp. CCNWLW3]|uniref:STAS domain-containing protein n=1 Tax=unclassified Lysobacter TaxID=2635362 RepID=UPI002FD6D71D
MSAATVRREGEALVFAGALVRTAVAALWRQAQPLLKDQSLRRLDLGAVSEVDSAGLALLAELAARVPGLSVIGTPPGLTELRAAYRLDEGLGFSS